MAEFELDGSGVMACLMSAVADNKTDNDTVLELGKSERAVLLYVADHPKATQDEVAAAVGIGRTAVTNRTSALQRKVLLRREGSRKSGTWVVLIDGQDTPR